MEKRTWNASSACQARSTTWIQGKKKKKDTQKAKKNVKTMKKGKKRKHEELVGKRVEVYWKDDNAWYRDGWYEWRQQENLISIMTMAIRKRDLIWGQSTLG